MTRLRFVITAMLVMFAVSAISIPLASAQDPALQERTGCSTVDREVKSGNSRSFFQVNEATQITEVIYYLGGGSGTEITANGYDLNLIHNGFSILLAPGGFVESQALDAYVWPVAIDVAAGDTIEVVHSPGAGAGNTFVNHCGQVPTDFTGNATNRIEPLPGTSGNANLRILSLELTNTTDGGGDADPGGDPDDGEGGLFGLDIFGAITSALSELFIPRDGFFEETLNFFGEQEGLGSVLALYELPVAFVDEFATPDGDYLVWYTVPGDGGAFLPTEGGEGFQTNFPTFQQQFQLGEDENDVYRIQSNGSLQTFEGANGSAQLICIACSDPGVNRLAHPRVQPFVHMVRVLIGVWFAYLFVIGVWQSVPWSGRSTVQI